MPSGSGVASRQPSGRPLALPSGQETAQAALVGRLPPPAASGSALSILSTSTRLAFSTHEGGGTAACSRAGTTTVSGGGTAACSRGGAAACSRGGAAACSRGAVAASGGQVGAVCVGLRTRVSRDIERRSRLGDVRPTSAPSCTRFLSPSRPNKPRDARPPVRDDAPEREAGATGGGVGGGSHEAGEPEGMGPIMDKIAVAERALIGRALPGRPSHRVGSGLLGAAGRRIKSPVVR